MQSIRTREARVDRGRKLGDRASRGEALSPTFEKPRKEKGLDKEVAEPVLMCQQEIAERENLAGRGA